MLAEQLGSYPEGECPVGRAGGRSTLTLRPGRAGS